MRPTRLTSLVLMMLLYVAVGVGCPPELNDIQLNPSEVEVEYGGSFSVICASNSNYTYLEWILAYNMFSSNETLEENNVTDWEIQAQCVMDLKGVECQKTLPITVYKLPDRVSISSVNHTGPMMMGGHYELRCDVQNVAPLHLLTVNWYKGATRVNQTNFSDPIKTPVDQSAVLRISPRMSDNGVQYWCEAGLNLRSQTPHPVRSDPLSLSISCPLSFQPPAAVVKYGDSVSVNCSTAASPTLMGWHASEGSVPPQSGVQLVTWRVESLTHLDIGPVCYINIEAGFCQQFLSVTVYKPPDSVKLNTFHTGPMIEGRTYELWCDVQNVAPLHLLTVNWYKGATLVHQTSFPDLVKTTVNQSAVFRISPNMTDDGAEYRCEAELNLGQDGHQNAVKSDALRITVESAGVGCPPELNDIQLNPPEVEVEYGGSFSVICASNSNYTYLEWILAYNMFSSNETLEENNVTDWEIQAQCVMDLKGVKCQKTLPINVYKLPDRVSISSVNHTEPMMMGGHYELRCDVQNVAPLHRLTVNWYKGATRVNQTNFSDPIKTPVDQSAVLRISPRMSDNGVQYWCEAGLNLRSQSLHPVRSDPLNLNIICLNFQPPAAVVKYGDSVSVNCSTAAAPTMMGWEASQGTVPPQSGVQFVTWRVESLTNFDIKPICYTEGGLCTRDLSVTLYKPPDSVKLNTFHTGPMIEGRTYELQCVVQEVAPVHLVVLKWYKGKTLIVKKSLAEVNKTDLASQRRKVSIVPDTTDDEVQYWCEAELKLQELGLPNSITVRSDPLNVTIQYAPKFKSLPSLLAVKEDGNVSLQCTAKGNPPPDVWWSSQYPNKTTGGRQDTLTISRATPADAGVYTCTARNSAGSDTWTVRLIVAGRASISTVNDAGPMMEGGHYELRCDVQNVASVHLRTVKWYKGATLVNQTSFSEPTKTPSAVLSISPRRTDDGVQYRCEVELKGEPDGLQNPITVTSDPLNLTVQYAPKIKLLSPTVSVQKDGNVTLHCTVQGKPHPDVWWSFQDEKLNTGSQQDTLTILKATPADAGVYTCTANNSAGSDTRTVSLIVAGRASISTVNDAGPMMEGGHYELRCDIQNVASVHLRTVKWYKGATSVNQTSFSEPTKTPSAVLSISPRRTDDGVQYRCEVELKGEPDGLHHPITVTSDPLNLTVQYAPKIKPLSRTVSVEKDGNVTLHCTVQGKPHPDVWWSFQDEKLNTGSQQDTLTILRATPADAGEYECTARNEMGNETMKILLIVHVKAHKCPPKIVFIVIGLILLLILFAILCWWFCVHKKRSGKYDLRSNDQVSMSLLSNGKSTPKQGS